MATIEVTGFVKETTPTSNLFGAVAHFWHEIVRQHREHRTIVQISRLDPHLIRDMGLDPERIHDALEASAWELDPMRRFPTV